MAKLTGKLIVSDSNGKGKIVVDLDNIKRAALTLRAINNPLRVKLLQLINSTKTIGVGEIYGRLKIEQSVASSQLGILRRAGLVNAQRKGQKILYSLNIKRIGEIAGLALKMAQESEG